MAKEFKKEDFEIVISTMDRNSLDFLIPMFPFCHFSEFQILIINQTSENHKLTSGFSGVRVINSNEKGLSKSRNLALQNTAGKILLITDDDVIFKKDFDSTIIDSYNKYPNATVISFAIEKPDGSLFKKYPSQTKENATLLDIFNILSIEISLNKVAFEKLNVKFDENFGLGSSFVMGEEAIFLNDLKLKNQQLIIEPKVIAIHPTISTADKLSLEQRYFIQGAFLARVLETSFYLSVFQKLFFDLKQKKIALNQIPAAIKSANKGQKDYYKTRNENNA